MAKRRQTFERAARKRKAARQAKAALRPPPQSESKVEQPKKRARSSKEKQAE